MNALRTPEQRALAATIVLALESAHREGVDLSLAGLGDGIRTAATADPLKAVTAVVLLSSALFYRAEHGVNEKVKTFGDALAYCSTSLSVGYHDIFPRTETGKAIMTFLHTLGPSLAARALDAPARETAARDEAKNEHDRAVLAKLEEIASALRERTR